jgi:mitochondrial fission protein ELM1
VEIVRLPEAPLAWILRFPKAAAAGHRPQLLIGAGHRTHLPLAFAAWWLRAKSVVIMQPTWPTRLFHLCLVPAHDVRFASRNMVATRGALNRIPEQFPSKKAQGMILIGGPSKHTRWDPAPLSEAIQAVINSRPGLSWVIGDSRRTPPDFLSQLAALNLRAEIVPQWHTSAGWLPAQLLVSEEVWVTEDSVSMLHEAVTAHARTGVLPMPVRKPRGRLARAIHGLVSEGYATRYETWRQTGQLPPPRPLHETARCADLILQRLFPSNRNLKHEQAQRGLVAKDDHESPPNPS